MAYVYPAPTDAQEVQYNSANADNKLILDYTRLGVKATGTLTATVSLFTPGHVAITTAGTGTALAAQISIAVDTTTTGTWVKDQDYIAEWTVTNSGSSTATVRTTFDVVQTKLFQILTEDHLLEHEPTMGSMLATGETSAAKCINAGWREIRARIRARGNRPAMIFDNYCLFMPHKHKALEIFYRSSSHGADDHWWQLSNFHMLEFEKSFADAMSNVKYDASDVGYNTDTLHLAQPRFRR